MNQIKSVRIAINQEDVLKLNECAALKTTLYIHTIYGKDRNERLPSCSNLIFLVGNNFRFHKSLASTINATSLPMQPSNMRKLPANGNYLSELSAIDGERSCPLAEHANYKQLRVDRVAAIQKN